MGYWKDERARYYKLSNTEATRVLCRGCGKSYKAFNYGWQIRHMERCEKLRDAALPPLHTPEPSPASRDETSEEPGRNPFHVLHEILIKNTGGFASREEIMAYHLSMLRDDEKKLEEDVERYKNFRFFPARIPRLSDEMTAEVHAADRGYVAILRTSIARYHQCIAYHHEQLRALEGDTTVIEAYRIMGA